MIANLLQRTDKGSWVIANDSVIQQIESLLSEDKCACAFQRMFETTSENPVVNEAIQNLIGRFTVLKESLSPLRQVAMEEIYRSALINQLAGIAIAIETLKSQTHLSGELQELSLAIVEASPSSSFSSTVACFDAADSLGSRPLHWAVLNGQIELVRFLVDKGAKVDAVDNRGTQPIHWAASCGQCDVVELLLSKGAAVNAEDEFGRQPLHKAAIKGDTKMAKLLLSKGANLDAADFESKKPLDWALFYKNSQLVKLLNLEPLLKAYRDQGYLTRFLDRKPFPIERSYINVTLVGQEGSEEEEEAEGSEEEEEATEWYQNVSLSQGNRIELPELFDRNTHLYIEGGAGSGKTTLCRYIVSSWASLNPEKLQETLGNWANRYEAILLLPLREIRSLSKAATLNDFILQRYPALSVDLFESSSTLYILDGFDEIASLEEICRSTQEDRRWKIVETLLQQPHWIITSRPNLFSERFYGSRRLHNSGFTTENVTAYIQSFCRDFKMPSHGLENAINSASELEVLAHNPLYLELVCSLWKENPGVLHSLHNLSTLYDKIAALLFRRHLTRVGENTTGLFHRDLLTHEKVRPYRECLEEIAFHSKRSGGNRIIPDLYQPLLERIPVEEREPFGKSLFDQLGLLTPVSDAKELFEQNYAFIHLTFEEYFAARYVVSRLESTTPLFGTVSAADWLKENCFSENFEKLIDFTVSLAVSDKQLHPLANALLSKRERANEWSYPLHRAAEMGLSKLADMLLSEGAKIDAADDKGYQPLHVAAKNGHNEVVELLLSKRAKIDAAANYGTQPLHEAASFGHKDVVELLLSMGAKIDAADNSGEQPLHLAASFGHKDVVELLLSKGAKTDAADNRGWQPLHFAAANGHNEVVELLLSKEAKIDAADNSGEQPLHLAASIGHKDVVELLLSMGAKIDAANKYGRQPLHLAAWNACKDTVELLISMGADVNAAGYEGSKPLHLAAYFGCKGVVELLLSMGAKIDVTDNFGFQPLHVAVENCHIKVIELLLSKGATDDAVDYGGKKPSDVAKSIRRPDIVELLLRNRTWVNVTDWVDVSDEDLPDAEFDFSRQS